MKVVLSKTTTGTALFINVLDYFSKKYSPKNFSPIDTASEFLKENSTIDEAEFLFGLPPIWPDDILINDNVITSKTENIYHNLGMFIQELKGLSAITYVNNNRGYKRMAIPPKEAYDYVGHNKLNVTDSMKSAAMLYED